MLAQSVRSVKSATAERTSARRLSLQHSERDQSLAREQNEAEPVRGPGFDFARINLGPIQRKPLVSSPEDASEREADAVAGQAMQMSSSDRTGPVSIRAKASPKPVIQSKPQSFANRSAALDTRAAVQAASRGGAPMSRDQLSWFQPRFGFDFSQVRLHTDGEAVLGARSVRARAYTAGRDIVFGAGEYAPHTAAGKHLLAHELAHVVQQHRTPGPPSVLMRAPAAKPDPAPTPTSLDQFSDADKQNFKFDTDIPDTPLILREFFGLKGTSADASNLDADVDFEIPAIAALKAETDRTVLYRGLRRVALSTFNLLASEKDGKAHKPRLNLVHIESLDLTHWGGPNGTFRFTCVGSQDKAGAIKTNILVEAVNAVAKGMADPAKEKDIVKRKAVPYGLKRGDSITDDSLWLKVVRSLGTIDEGLIMRIRDVTFETSPQQTGADGEAAYFEYHFATKDTGPWKKTITLYQKIAVAEDADFARMLDHEIGHAIDVAPAEKPGGKIAKAQVHDLDKFKEAAKKDGGIAKSITAYGGKSDKEFFAENLSLFIQQPETFQTLRPNLYMYFLRFEWEAVKDQKLNAPSTIWSTAPKAKP
jgi:hypothetical protein